MSNPAQKFQAGIPGEGVQGLDEVVAVALIFLGALQQGSSSVHHVTGQEAVLKAKVNAECLDTDVIHTGGVGGFRLSVNASESNKLFCGRVVFRVVPVFIGRLLNDVS